MIGIGIRIDLIKTSNPVSVVVATSATGVGETSFTANWNLYSGAQYYLLDVSTSSSFSSFILQNQVVSTNSYLVTGLTANTTYYYRVRASTDPDADAQAYFDRVTTAGGTLTTTEKTAVNQLVIDLKANSLWTPMKAIYPMVGSSAAACAQNLKSSSFTGTFTSGWTFSSSGATPNGTSAYMNTGLAPSGNLGLNSSHISYYSRTNSNTTELDIGAGTTINISSLFIEARTAGITFFKINTDAIFLSFSDSDSRAWYMGNRNSSTTFQGWKNSVSTSITTNSRGLTANNIYIGAANIAGVASFFSTKQCAFASIGDGLTDTQASALYNAVQTMNTTLSRNV
jgi:hypothetical protein